MQLGSYTLNFPQTKLGSYACIRGLYLHEKINSLVARKVVDHMAVQELCLLCWHLMIQYIFVKHLMIQYILMEHLCVQQKGKIWPSDDDDDYNDCEDS